MCRGNLHQSHYLRKPRGVPKETHPDYPVRFSYCCGVDGCRKRFTPPSMRFLSRKVYSSNLARISMSAQTGHYQDTEIGG